MGMLGLREAVLPRQPSGVFLGGKQGKVAVCLHPVAAHMRGEGASFSEAHSEEPGSATMESLVAEVNLFLSRLASVDFQVAEAFGKVVVQVREGKTGALILRIPAEAFPELLREVHGLDVLLSGIHGRAGVPVGTTASDKANGEE